MSIAFRDLPVYDLTGATRNFEQLTTASFPPNGAAGGALSGEYPNPKLAVPYTKGTSKLVFSASKNSATLKIVHGLGKTPSVVFAMSLEAAAFETLPTFNIVAREATEFSINGEVVKAAFTGEPPFMWLAVA